MRSQTGGGPKRCAAYTVSGIHSCALSCHKAIHDRAVRGNDSSGVAHLRNNNGRNAIMDKAAAKALSERVCRVRPDPIDLRDCPYRPSIASAPSLEIFPSRLAGVKDQG